MSTLTDILTLKEDVQVPANTAGKYVYGAGAIGGVIGGVGGFLIAKKRYTGSLRKRKIEHAV